MNIIIYKNKTVSFIKKHKIISAVIALVLLTIGWRVYGALNSTSGETRYVLSSVEKGTIIASVSGTGQVSASDQVDIQSKSSGELTYLNAKVGQSVAAGTLIAGTDPTDDAFQLESAKISYDQLVNASPSDIADAETSVAEAHTSAQATLIQTSSDLSDVDSSINDLLDGYLEYKPAQSRTVKGKIDATDANYQRTEEDLNTFLNKYSEFGSASTYTDIENLIDEAYNVSLNLLQAAKNVKDTVVYMRSIEDASKMTEADNAYTSINDIISNISSIISNLTSTKTSLKNANDAINNLKNPDTLSVRSEELNLKQKEQAYADHFIRAPFSGIIASVSAQKGDTVSGSTTIATLITRQKVAEISLNEIDAAKIKVGQKATLTFDAIENLSLTGEVIEVDLVGSVSQGVVSYNVKIGFDTADDRVKPGMTASANIITDVRQDVLFVSASAVKTSGNIQYVDVVSNPPSGSQSSGGLILSTPPQSVQVTTGLSNDESIEIISGLTEGEQYVVRTIANTGASATSQSTPSLFSGNRTEGFSGATRAFSR